MLLIFAQCKEDGNGIISSKLAISDASASWMKGNYNDSVGYTDLRLDSLEKDTADVSKHFLVINLSYEKVSFFRPKQNEFHFINSAYATPPQPLPTSTFFIDSIEILSDQAFNQNYPATSSLTKIFRVIRPVVMSANKFEYGNEPVEQIVMQATEFPDSIRQHKMIVRLHQFYSTRDTQQVITKATYLR